VVRDTGSAPPYRTVLVPYSPVLKASGNLGAKPLEITLGFAVLGTTNDGWNRRVSIVVVACLLQVKVRSGRNVSLRFF